MHSVSAGGVWQAVLDGRNNQQEESWERNRNEENRIKHTAGEVLQSLRLRHLFGPDHVDAHHEGAQHLRHHYAAVGLWKGGRDTPL